MVTTLKNKTEVNKMLYRSHEVQGTDLPIFRQKSEDLLTHEEMILLSDRLDKFKIAGYVQVIKFGKVFFEPVYGVRN
ncbi:hypothetical protein [Mesobacillus sp.]|uniref:hypothetical protein n=1 Tax=Mesobacillus sp. TaxID=2675271 RepID=UPI0039F0A5AE